MNGGSWPRFVLPPLAVVLGVLGLQLAYDVSLGDALLYLAYELTFVIAPGWLLYRALSSRPGGGLRQLAIGWALGYVIEILAFMLTAATDTRDLFIAYPIAVGLPALAVMRRRRAQTAAPADDQRLTYRVSWLIAALCLIAAAYVALAYFPLTSLPGSESVRYQQDFPWALSIAAEAKNHWPIEDPNVSGMPFPYHYFVHVHFAAISQATGLELPLVLFRLYILPLVVLAAILLVVAGQSLARSAFAGVIAACLALLVGDVTLDHGLLTFPFLGVLFTYLFGSPSFLLGLVLFLPLIIVLGEVVSSSESPGIGEWVLIALLLIGISDAKIVLLPLVLGSLALYSAWWWFAERRVPRTVLVAAGLTLLVAGALYLLQYRGHPSDLEVDPSVGLRLFTEQMGGVAIVKDYFEGLLPEFPGRGFLLSSGGVAFGAFGLFAAQLLGIVWLLSRGRRLEPHQAWFLAILCAGVIAVLVLDFPGTGNALYILGYGMVAGCTLAAAGLWMAWQGRPPITGQRARLGALAMGGAALLATVMLVPGAILNPDDPASVARTFIVSYGALILGLILIVMVAGRWAGSAGWIGAGVVSGVIIAAGALDTLIERAETGVRPLPPPDSGRRVTPELFEALTWVRENSTADSVISVNNLEALEFNYGAFAERRVFLGGWAYSVRPRERLEEVFGQGFALGIAGPAGSQLYPRRVRLNEAVFADGNRRAMEILSNEYGVRYLIVDEINGYPANLEAIRRFTRPVYEGPGVTVFELAAGGPTAVAGGLVDRVDRVAARSGAKPRSRGSPSAGQKAAKMPAAMAMNSLQCADPPYLR